MCVCKLFLGKNGGASIRMTQRGRQYICSSVVSFQPAILKNSKLARVARLKNLGKTSCPLCEACGYSLSAMKDLN